MIDIKKLRDNPERYREGARRKGFDAGVQAVDRALALDEERRKLQASIDQRKKELGEKSAAMKKAGSGGSPAGAGGSDTRSSASMPRSIGGKKCPLISGSSRPMVSVRRLSSCRAAGCGEKLSSAMAARTRCSVSATTAAVPFSTRLTVAGDTPARLATSTMVERRYRPVLIISFS